LDCDGDLSVLPPSGGDLLKLSLTSQKELVEELKIFWKRLWQERVDDKVRAEGIAAKSMLSCLWRRVLLFMLRVVIRR
jgi:hypothetical protein